MYKTNVQTLPLAQAPLQINDLNVVRETVCKTDLKTQGKGGRRKKKKRTNLKKMETEK